MKRISLPGSRRRGLRWFASVATMALLAALPAAAGAGEAEDDALYDAAITALAEAARSLDEREAGAAPGRVDVYVGQASSSRWRLDALSWRVDQQAPGQQVLPDSLSSGLAEQGERLRLERLPATDAARTIEVQVTISDRAQPAVAALQLSRSLVLEPAGQDRALEFIVDGSLLGRPGIEVLLRSAAAPRAARSGLRLAGLVLPTLAPVSRYVPGSHDDPALRRVRCLRREGDVEAADRELQAIALRAGGEARMPAAWTMERMRSAIALGRLERAAEIGEQLALSGDNPAELAIERLRLVEAELAIGAIDAAEGLLPLARQRLPAARRQDWQHLQGRVLLARARNAEAVAALDSGDQTDDAFRYMQQSTAAVQDSAYRRYNLAVAMLRNGDEARGLSWLDLLGRSQASDAQLLALRDKANLALGWHFLKARQGRTALGVLGRIPLDGPQADRALLGMGWAMLAPNGARQPRVDLDRDAEGQSRRAKLPAPLRVSLLRLRALEPELNGAIAPDNFERDAAPVKRDDALRAAIRVWQPLLDRDERSIAALEARLAVGHALDQLRDAAGARLAYREAVAALRRVEADLAAQRARLAGGALLAAAEHGEDRAALYAQMDRLQLPYDDRSAPLYTLLGEHARWQKLEVALREAADRLATIAPGREYAGAALDGELPAAGEAGLLAQIGNRREQLLHRAEEQALSLLDARARQVQAYLAAALFALARLEDDPRLDERGAVDCSRGCR